MDRNFERLTKDGRTFVLVPEDVYEDLQEDAEMLADIQAFDAAESRNEEAFPAELGIKLTDAHRAGKSLVPVWREYRGMTQTTLADASGVNRVYLSEIESGKKPGSVEALKRIAEALRIGLDDLV
jgi:DNA-binding XRE family transcriptional regulator